MSAAFRLAVQPLLCFGELFRRAFGRVAPSLHVAFCQCQLCGVAIARIGLQGIHAFARRERGAPGVVTRRDCCGFHLLCLLECGLRLVARRAGIVETGLRLPQLACLAARQHASVDAVALLELCHRLLQLAGFLQPVAILFKLVECLGDVAQQSVRQWR